MIKAIYDFNIMKKENESACVHGPDFCHTWRLTYCHSFSSSTSSSSFVAVLCYIYDSEDMFILAAGNV